jgi:hypothetical protein
MPDGAAVSAASAIERAEAFLETSTPRLVAGYVAALREPALRGAFRQELECLQQSDGSFSPEVGHGASLVESTAWVLELIDGLRLLDSSLGESAVSFLAKAQEPDGGFGAQTAPAARLEESALVAGLLAKSPFASRRTLQRAGAFLEANWSEERVRAGSLVDIDAYFHWFTNHPGELADAALQWCGRELERAFRLGRVDPVFAARIFLRCGALALPAAKLSVAELVPALIAAQRPDGSFRDACISHVPTATLTAVRALIAF